MIFLFFRELASVPPAALLNGRGVGQHAAGLEYPTAPVMPLKSAGFASSSNMNRGGGNSGRDASRGAGRTGQKTRWNDRKSGRKSKVQGGSLD